MFGRYPRLTLILSLLTLATGCASNPTADQRDPLEGYNRAMFEFNDQLDRAVMRPVAETYEENMPGPINTGISNFFGNLNDVVVLVNDLLQFKLKQAASDLGRITFNTTVGLGGLIDVATPMDFPKHYEDFGQTLGYWGIPAGPYLILPILGPSSIRDSGGLAVDGIYLDPIYQADVHPDTRWTAVAVRGIDTRASLLQASRMVDQAAIDPYIFIRESYLQRRENLVYDGHPPTSELDDFDRILEEDAAQPAPPAGQP